MTKQEKAKEMCTKVAAWKQSGMSMIAYAQSIGMSPSGFEYWVRKYRKEYKKLNDEFVQVFPSIEGNSEQKRFQHPPVERSQGEIVFSFANGMTIRVSL